MEVSQLSLESSQTLQKIFQLPAPHNLEWRDVCRLVEEMGTVHEVKNGHWTLTINGISQAFFPPYGKAMPDARNVSTIRRFFEKVGISKDGEIIAQHNDDDDE